MAKHSEERNYSKHIALLAAFIPPGWSNSPRIRYGVGPAAAAATLRVAAAVRAGTSDGDKS